MKGFVVEIYYSQTDSTYVFVEGSKTPEEAVEIVKKRTSCIRVYKCGRIDRVIKV